MVKVVARLFFGVLFSCCSVVLVVAEGTKEFIPSGSSGKGDLLIGTNGAHTFATASSSADYRLYIHVKDFMTETIRFGFGNASNGNPHYTLHRPDGSEVCTGPVPKTPGAGYISTYAEAIAGPFPLAGGYTPIQCDPDVNGDFYLEIHNLHPSGTHLDYTGSLAYFDLTIISTPADTVIRGRVWAKCWQFDCGSPNNFNDYFDGKVFIYSTDSIVTSIDFIMTPAASGDPYAFIPAEWDLLCNASGCYPIGAGMPFDEARRSVNTTAGYPQYKLFLNDPDSTVYPSGMMGEMIGSPTFLAKCDGTYDISMMATKAGIVEIYIEISLTDPPQNVTLRENVLAAPVVNTVTWDGLDGYGNPVPSGTPVTMSVKYINGLTNFPVTNVDINTNGFQVELERPSGSAPHMYWDDQTYFPTLGTTNLAGCQYTTAGDCHVWDWRAFGHDKTINTWWYVASSTAAPVTNLVEREPPPPDSIAGPDSVCQNWSRSYTLFPDPLPDADTNGYEWILLNTVTGTIDQTWSNAGTMVTIDFSGFSPGNKRLKVRGSNAECGFGPFGPGASGEGIPIVVEAKPAITNNTTMQICSEETTNILLTSTGPPSTTYGYKVTASSANVTGYSNGTTNPIQQTLINTGSTVETVTYAVAGTNWQCPGDTAHLQVQVAPIPTDSTSPDAYTLCSGDTTDITLVSSVTGTTYTWTASGSSVNISGYSGGSGSFIGQILTNSGFSTETVSYTIIPTANGCNGPPLIFTVTVYPTPDVSNATTSFAQCNGATTGITLTSHVTGTSFSWLTSASSSNLGGYSDGSGVLIAQTLTNSGFTTETVTYEVSPVANGCVGVPVDFTVSVYPVPDVSNAVLAFEQCTGDTTSIGLTSHVTGTSYTWTATGSSGNVGGFSGGSGEMIEQKLINTGFIPEMVTYTVTPAANGCQGIPADFTVTVYPGPDLSNAITDFSVCNGETTSISLTSNVAGTSFSWTASGSSSSVSGYADDSGTMIAQTLTNSGFSVETVTYSVTPAANGCQGNPVDFTVTVFPTPDVSNIVVDFALCNGDTTDIHLISSVTGTTFSWTASGSSANVGGYANGNGFLIRQTLTNSGYSVETVVYTVTPSANGCTGNAQLFTVTVYPTPDVSTVTGGIICTDDTTNILLTSNVTGTSYTWLAFGSSPNVTGYTDGSGDMIVQQLFNLGFDTEEVKYQVTPWMQSCRGLGADLTTQVLPAPDLQITPASEEFCSGGTTGIVLSSTVSGTLFYWTSSATSPEVTGHSSGNGSVIQQTLSSASLAVETVTYSILPIASGCRGPGESAGVTVNPLPWMAFTLCDPFELTTSSKPLILKGGLPFQGVYSGSGVVNGMFDPALAGSGIHTITYTYANMYGCSGYRSQPLTVILSVPHGCGDPLTDIRDNQTYATIQIGSQCWMAENLNFGTVITPSTMQSDNCIPEKYCQDGIPGNCLSNGGRYQWNELMAYTETPGGTGLCPPEWHIPSETEWNDLFSLFYNNAFAGDSLKEGGHTAFDAGLDGVRFNNAIWEFHDWAIMFWSSSAHGPSKAWAHGINSYNHSVSYYPAFRHHAFPVRCIRD